MISVIAGTAVADPATARKAYEKGAVAYKLQNYGDALELFKRAYEEHQDPVILYNIAQCQRLLGKNKEAIRSYRLYLSDGTVDDATRAQVQKLIAETEEAERAHPQPAETPPAPTVIAAPAPVVAPAPAASSAAIVVDRPSPWYRSGLGWGLVGGGVAALAVGGGLLAHGNELDSDIRSASSLAQAQQLGDDRDTYRHASFALFAVGGAALVSGAVVFAVFDARHRAHVRVGGGQ